MRLPSARARRRASCCGRCGCSRSRYLPRRGRRRRRPADRPGRTPPAVVGRHARRGDAGGRASRCPTRPRTARCSSLIALVVTAGTLLLQGSTLPWLARRLGVRGPDPREDALQEATVLRRRDAAPGSADRAGRRRRRGDRRDRSATSAADRVNRSWERLGHARPGDDETPSEAYRAAAHGDAPGGARRGAAHPRRAAASTTRCSPRVLATLDVEESMLDRQERDAARRGAEDAAPAGPTPAPATTSRRGRRGRPPSTPEGCADCLREGTTWVHLRLCLTCGNVGCCDSSVGKHAERALPRDRPPGDAQLRARRGVALVLRRRGARLAPGGLLRASGAPGPGRRRTRRRTCPTGSAPPAGSPPTRARPRPGARRPAPRTTAPAARSRRRGRPGRRRGGCG